MAKYGIKEVADVRFYKVGEVSVDSATGAVVYPTGSTPTPKLILDTLKVSTIEFTGEQSEARGGKGNPPLIIWDYGREINVTLEDALMSTEMLHLMFGSEATGGRIEINANSFPGTYAIVGKTFARDDDGDDHIFTFYIPKAKIQSENTLTMEAEGDPSVFNLSLRVLADNGKMMELILDTANEKSTITDAEWEGGNNVKYAITFVSDEFVTTMYVTKGATITAPAVPTGKKWDMPANAAATGNVTYYAVAE